MCARAYQCDKGGGDKCSAPPQLLPPPFSQNDAKQLKRTGAICEDEVELADRHIRNQLASAPGEINGKRWASAAVIIVATAIAVHHRDDGVATSSGCVLDYARAGTGIVVLRLHLVGKATKAHVELVLDVCNGGVIAVVDAVDVEIAASAGEVQATGGPQA